MFIASGNWLFSAWLKGKALRDLYAMDWVMQSHMLRQGHSSAKPNLAMQTDKQANLGQIEWADGLI